MKVHLSLVIGLLAVAISPRNCICAQPPTTISSQPTHVVSQPYSGPVAKSRLEGVWKVDSFTTRTLTLDGKKTLKGPFTLKEKDMTVTIDSETYTEDNGGRITKYSILPKKNFYVLTRVIEKKIIEIRMTDVHISEKTLSFVSTRIDRSRKERTIVRWSLSRVLPQSIIDTEWELIDIQYGDDTVVKPLQSERLTLLIHAGTVSGIAGVNRYNGPAKVGTDRTLKLGPFATTLAADPEGSAAPNFLRDLAEVKSYLIDKGQLILVLPVDVGVIRLQRRK